MLAGVAELANLCSLEGDAYLSATEAASAYEWIRAFGALDEALDDVLED